MQVSELIEKLKELNPESPVFYSDTEYGYEPVEEVYPHTDKVVLA